MGDTEDCSSERAEQEERMLIARVAAGDRVAFECLYRRYHPRLLRFIARTLHSPTATEEVLNDTLLVVWRRAATFNASCKLSTWIFAIAYRTALKALRRLDIPVEGPVEDMIDTLDAGPEATLMALQQASRVQALLADLSPEQRAVVELGYFHDFSYREIAEVLSCPVDTVKTRMFHARRKLRLALLAPDGKLA